MRRLVSLAALMLMQGAWAYAQPQDQGRAEDEGAKLEEARQHYERGKAHHVLEQYEEAAREYLKAFDLSGRPSLLFNAAQVYRLADNPDAALEHYEHYLALEPDGPGAAVAHKYVSELRTEIEERLRREEAERERASLAAETQESAPADLPASTGAASLILSEPEARNGMASPGARQWLSGRLSGAAQAIFDYKLRGAVLATSVGLFLDERSEVRVAGIIGATTGISVGGVLSLSTGEWRPVIGLGIPIFFSHGARVAVRGSGGVEWRITRHLGLTAEIGIERVLNPEWDRAATALVPILGMRAQPWPQ